VKLTILVPARNEADALPGTIEALRAAFPDADVIVADDGSSDRTAEVAERAGALTLRLQAQGKGQALSAAERVAGPGCLLLCDADLRGDLRPLLEEDADVAVAAFAQRIGGGFGVTKGIARLLVRARCGLRPREPISGQRALSPAARAACFPLASGFGADVRLTIDAARAGLTVREVELPLSHRATGRDVAGFLHRGRQLVEVVLACGPLAVNHRGARLPLVGVLVALAGAHAPRRTALGVAGTALVGLADDFWSGEERGFRAHLRGRWTTGTLKLAAIPGLALWLTRSMSGAALVGLGANAVNQLDTRPGRALKAFLAGALALRGGTFPYATAAVVLCPYDLREKVMLGDAGSNALGAVLGYESVRRLTGRGRLTAIAGLTALTILGEARSLGRLIEQTNGLAQLDRLGRLP